MKLFNMKTRKMVDKSFSQYLVYQAFQAVTHDIFNDKTWFPTSRCSCEDVFYEVFCIVDKMMFSHTDTESRLAFVEGIGQYGKNYVDEDEYATAQDERQRIVFVILYMAAMILHMMPLESKVFQFCSMIMGQWRGYVTQEFLTDAWNRWRRTGMWLNSWQPKSVIMARMVSSFHLRSMN